MIGFIGAGNMATAIIKGATEKAVFDSKDLLVYDISRDKMDKIKQMGLNVSEGPDLLVKHCNIIFLCIKPQNIAKVIHDIRHEITEEKLIVSIAAGISTGYIEKCVGRPCKVIRTMPNTPLMIGQGATAICKNNLVTEPEFKQIIDIFSSVGVVEVIDESLMNAVTSVNGSSPAYLYLFAKAVIEGAVQQGINPEVAKRLFAQTMKGSALMLLNSGCSPQELIDMVASKKGTTEKALETLYQHNFEQIIIDAMLNCTRRANELSL